MKFSKLSQLFLVSTIGLIVATLLTACQIITIDYVFVASSVGSGAGSAGQIETYAVDSETGALRVAAPSVPSGGVGPISMATTSDYANLYVANQGNKSVVHFAVASNGVLTMKDAVTLAATPVYLTVNSANTYLYVVSGTSSATLTEYALSTGAIGSATSTQNLSLPGFPGDTLIPTGVNVLNNGAAVYVTAYDQSAYNPGGVTTSSANPGWVFGFNVGSGGALTTVAANTPLSSPWKAGVKPSAVTSDLANAYVYVTDFPSNELIGYSIESGSTLNFLINGPFKTGNEPTAITIDPRDEYIYVSNSLDSTVIGYTLTRTTGTPSTLAYNPGSASNQTDTQPVSIAVDPALGRFVFTANHLGNSISGFRLVPDTGVLSTTLATPFPTGDAPTALAIVPHGNHSVQQITP